MMPHQASFDGSDARLGGRNNSQGSDKVRHLRGTSDPGAGRQAWSMQSEGAIRFSHMLSVLRKAVGFMQGRTRFDLIAPYKVMRYIKRVEIFRDV
jgi:hypothetical protein